MRTVDLLRAGRGSRGRALIYVDSSALVKLVIREDETAALLRLLSGHATASSAVCRVELLRAARRAAAPGRGEDVLAAARRVLSAVNTVSLDEQIIDSAARLDPPELRSLDALHLASALRVRGSITAFVCYDQRLSDAAARAGLPVANPS